MPIGSVGVLMESPIEGEISGATSNDVIREMAIQQMMALQWPPDSVLGRDLRAICVSAWKQRWLIQTGKWKEEKYRYSEASLSLTSSITPIEKEAVYRIADPNRR